jgi:hypothetical protein
VKRLPLKLRYEETTNLSPGVHIAGYTTQATPNDGCNWSVSAHNDSGHFPSLVHGALLGYRDPWQLVERLALHTVGAWIGRNLRALDVAATIRLEDEMLIKHFPGECDRFGLTRFHLGIFWAAFRAAV